MDIILYFFRDKIAGTYYFIYAFICLMLMFSIIGYLYKQKYAKVEVKLNTSQPKKDEKVAIDNQVKVEKTNNNQGFNLLNKKEETKEIKPVNNPNSQVSNLQVQNVNQTNVNSTTSNQVGTMPVNQNILSQQPQTPPSTQTVKQVINPIAGQPNVTVQQTQQIVKQQSPVVNQTQINQTITQPVNKNIEIK